VKEHQQARRRTALRLPRAVCDRIRQMKEMAPGSVVNTRHAMTRGSHHRARQGIGRSQVGDKLPIAQLQQRFDRTRISSRPDWLRRLPRLQALQATALLQMKDADT
jgi:hypothetical protein